MSDSELSSGQEDPFPVGLRPSYTKSIFFKLEQQQSPLNVVGPGGSGKDRLLLDLATHPRIGRNLRVRSKQFEGQPSKLLEALQADWEAVAAVLPEEGDPPITLITIADIDTLDPNSAEWAMPLIAQFNTWQREHNAWLLVTSERPCAQLASLEGVHWHTEYIPLLSMAELNTEIMRQADADSLDMLMHQPERGQFMAKLLQDDANAYGMIRYLLPKLSAVQYPGGNFERNLRKWRKHYLQHTPGGLKRPTGLFKRLGLASNR